MPSVEPRTLYSKLGVIFFLAILYYDYLLTLPWEIQFLWSSGKQQGWVTVACLLNRYLPLFGHIPLAVSYLTTQRDITVRPSYLSYPASLLTIKPDWRLL